MVTIPTSSEYPSLNLAGAVQILAYELFRARTEVEIELRRGLRAVRFGEAVVAGRDDERALAAERPVDRRLDVSGIGQGLVPGRVRVFAPHPGAVRERLDGLDRCVSLLARPLKTTFHRAFDMSRNLEESLDAVIAAGVDRVLTSGGEQRVEHGTTMVNTLNIAARGRIAIMAGGGINDANVHMVMAATGVREIHASAAVSASSPMRYRNEKISMGAMKGREYQRLVVLEDKVRRLLHAAVDGTRHPVKAR